MTGPWEILETTEYATWFGSLTEKQQVAVRNRVEALAMGGPSLGRPYVDSLRGSRFKGLKELRVASNGHLRILFIFDPARRCLLILGGDKSRDNRWNDWYRTAIAEAEQIYERYRRGDTT